MEFGGNMFCLNNRDQNGNTNNNGNTFAWDSWETPANSSNNNNNNNTSSRLVNAFHLPAASRVAEADGSVPATRHEAAGLASALMFLPQNGGGMRHRQQQQHPYGGDGSHVHPDPHLMCLKLGKRHYFEDTSGSGSGSVAAAATLGGGLVLGDKRGKGYSSGGGASVKAAGLTAVTVPRCQVEGCHLALLNAKDYHRRHKVCEMHSKAPKVVVLGMEQRFCQQCSRFHVVSEFDNSKRSCRRRLAGHNERRRKSSHDSVARNSSKGGCALSLLSSRSDSWLSPSDLSIRCSAALRELIAENRAAIMARQFVSDRDWHNHHHAVEDFKEIQPESNYFPQQMFPQTQ
ncbi:hypothetical protein AAZX31_01G069300 [Glycine max]|uniref:SBP-type domain-containing protein n=2 Tax=Glycine subgen. Soja TaxID=1462606 RepID=K7K2H7_SOYBN|nr:squamosa promoter-binding-like protein 7 isoform X1 [Glycine max]XP_028232895.1 squamosa promoter-binding-like protein 7 isoform X1 [Glycine soja]KAG5068475.1 hypothetical protein JHK85_000852 [Glycine max]KAG5088211.1 hypothetical protein JHK86_000823 [Glycine max]KAH1162080.1 hypothetical protein GYH30_000810 [Glycine max]KAH1265142.1 Squamosa promoter-binding-like protein 7 [Glycine max]KRH75287.1 hypothetical protein GLYMA_01G075800v4 [Glycine max]|eukprot:XP_003517942.1 squamosa promoter-binding-like protein 7 isoform X1 [Glycine max]